MTSRRDLVCIKFWLLTQFSLDLLNSFEPPSMFDLPTQIKKIPGNWYNYKIAFYSILRKNDVTTHNRCEQTKNWNLTILRDFKWHIGVWSVLKFKWGILCWNKLFNSKSQFYTFTIAQGEEILGGQQNQRIELC